MFHDMGWEGTLITPEKIWEHLDKTDDDWRTEIGKEYEELYVYRLFLYCDIYKLEDANDKLLNKLKELSTLGRITIDSTLQVKPDISYDEDNPSNFWHPEDVWSNVEDHGLENWMRCLAIDYRVLFHYISSLEETVISSKRRNETLNSRLLVLLDLFNKGK